MTVTLDITSDIDQALRDVDDFFWTQIPFAMGGALTDTAFDSRRRIVGSTWEKAFDVNNARFPGVAFKVMKNGQPARRAASALKRDLVTTGTASLDLGQALDRDFVRRQAEGGTKTPRGGTIAVPVRPGEVRGASGRVLKSKKPLALEKRKDHYTLKRGGRKVAVMKRARGSRDTTAVYLFIKQAGIKKSFQFYEDAEETALRVFPRHFDNRFARAIRSSRFFPA